MNLAELQAAYRDYLLTGDSAGLAPAIVADAFDSAERLTIYRNNFLIGLGEALKANFPVTLQLVGRDFFEHAARRFILAHPPRRPCLFEYGEEFPGYLAGLPQLAAMPYVSEMARFEFARIASYNAPAQYCLSAVGLAGLTPEELDTLPIRLARHVQLISVSAPILELWKAHQQPEPDVAGIDMTPRPRTLLICRPARSLVVRELAPPAVRFLSAAGDGTRLGLAAAQCGADDAILGAIIAMSLELELLAEAIARA